MVFLFPFHYFVLTSECDIFPSVRTADFTFQGARFVFQCECADETLSKSAASAFCITAGHICTNYRSTWTAAVSQCSSEFVILAPSP